MMRHEGWREPQSMRTNKEGSGRQQIRGRRVLDQVSGPSASTPSRVCQCAYSPHRPAAVMSTRRISMMRVWLVGWPNAPIVRTANQSLFEALSLSTAQPALGGIRTRLLGRQREPFRRADWTGATGCQGPLRNRSPWRLRVHDLLPPDVVELAETTTTRSTAPARRQRRLRAAVVYHSS